MREYIDLFRNTNYVKYLTARFISKFGDILYTLAIMWYILDKTGSPKAVGMLLVFSNLPQIVIGLFSGIAVDRFDRKLIMIISDFIRGAIIILIWFILDYSSFNLALIYVCAFLLEMFDILFSTANSSVLPNIVSKEHILKANALNQTVFQVLDIAGFAISGIFLAVFSLGFIFMINSASFIISGLIIITMKSDSLSKTRHENNQNILEDIKEGFSYIIKDKFLISFIIMLAISNIAYGAIQTLPAVLSKNVLNVGAEGLGFIQTFLSIGMLLGTVILGILKVKSPGKYFIFGLFLSGLVVLLIGNVNQLTLVITLYFLYGMSDAFTLPIFSYLQIHIEDHVRGRIFSLINVMVLALLPIAMGLSGILSEYIGVKLVYILSGLFLIVASVIGIFSSSLRQTKLPEIN